MTRTVSAYIGLGSNLGDRRAAIESALAALAARENIDLVRVSAIVETAPHLPPGEPGHPAASVGPYLNAVVHVRTTMTPRDLLDACLAIEASLGRRRTRESRWEARPIDLDVLLHGESVIDEPGLRIPHPRMHERAFVLGPLAEIAAEVVHPGLGRSIEWLRDRRRGEAAGG